MKHKRVSRRELKDNIQDLNWRLSCMEDILNVAKAKYAELEKRFISIAKDTREIPTSGPVRTITADVKAYGHTAILDPDSSSEYFEEVFEEVKNQMAVELARGLMEQNMIKIIEKPADGIFEGGTTIGAKIYVIPWEQMSQLKDSRKIEFEIGEGFCDDRPSDRYPEGPVSGSLSEP